MRGGSAQRQIRIVDRAERQTSVVLPRHAVRSGADRPAVRHLRAGIGRDHRNRAEPGVGGHRLGKAHGRTAADDQEAVGVLLLGVVDDAWRAVPARRRSWAADGYRRCGRSPATGCARRSRGPSSCTGSARGSTCGIQARPAPPAPCRSRKARARLAIDRRNCRTWFRWLPDQINPDRPDVGLIVGSRRRKFVGGVHGGDQGSSQRA